MRGRKPIPTAIKRARGNPGKRPLNDNEPQPEKRIPPCPSFIDAEAKRLWSQLGKLLLANGVLSEMDGLSLATLCQAWSRWKFAEEHIQKFGPIILSPDKKFPIQSPYLAVANKCMEQINKILIEFGMTPSSRSRIETLLDQGPSDFDEFLAEGRRIRASVELKCKERMAMANEFRQEQSTHAG
ncbi:Phage terminase, small subunit [Phycisphaerae bacterium RAS2]|nr:Phage terminase, small subunit [Phycisphaerae bacterium RAS2]